MRKANRHGSSIYSSRIYLRLDPKDIGILKFFLEAHDNLAYLSTVSPYTAIVRLVFAPEQEDEVREFLETVKTQTPWTEVWSAQGQKSEDEGQNSEDRIQAAGFRSREAGGMEASHSPRCSNF